MDRRTALQQLALIVGGSLAGPIAQAASSGKVMVGAAPPSLLTTERRNMIVHLAELIIPRTDTPGATEAGVPEFIDRIVTSWYSPAERHIFFAGLLSLDKFCEVQFHRSFNACDVEQQTAALTDAENASSSFSAPPGDGILGVSDEQSPFFYKLKQLTVLGYYTSEIGATQELSYNPIPGSYDGDFDFSKVGRQWSS